LTPHEFGRVLVHLSRRRGALGLDADSKDEGKMKDAVARVRAALAGRTFGEYMADLYDERTHPVEGKTSLFRDPIRNRRDSYEFHADRALIEDEFSRLWHSQKSRGGPVSGLLTDELLAKLNSSHPAKGWRQQGAIFGQRKTYWNQGSLSRCALEPTDLCCPQADMHAQEFRVLECVNNLRIEKRGELPRPLTPEERKRVVEALCRQKTATPATVRKALGIHKKEIKDFYTLNVERDPDREINTNWFAREIVLAVFGEEAWGALSEQARESVNRAIQKFDPDSAADRDTLRAGCGKWWGLNADQTEKLLTAWAARPNLSKRISLSRRAVLKLLPHVREGLSVSEAKAAAGYPASGRTLNKAGRRFASKHPGSLPPAPYLSNPVVRKAIHETRRQVNAYVRHFGRKPDRVVVELARDAKQPAVLRNQQLAENRARAKEFARLVKEFELERLGERQQRNAILRIRLAAEQRFECAYSGRRITSRMAAHGQSDEGERIEVDHIIPQSRTDDNSFNNLVLCYAGSNRDKGNRTPREWLTTEAFRLVEQRFAHLAGKDRLQIDGFEVRPNRRKWENLHREAPTVEDFASSQLTDTAYAARQVAAYLEEALYGGDDSGKRHVFCTKGRYTPLLRNDWQLYRDGRPKERTDHREHALDAVAVACTSPAVIQEVARRAEEQELAKVASGMTPRRRHLLPPWGTADEFRSQVLGAIDSAIVCHRPAKRRIAGALHEDSRYGVVDVVRKLFVIRIPIGKLTAKMLRMPRGDVSSPVAEDHDLALGKGGLVRDLSLRRRLRECLSQRGLDPDRVTDKEVQDVGKAGGFTTTAGVPIRQVRVLRTIAEPVVIGSCAFIGGNNHHMPIWEDLRTGKWSGVAVSMFEAAQRVRQSDGRLSPVDRTDPPGRKFVMSLSEGETIHARRPDRPADAPEAIGYFIVTRVARTWVEFASHTDAAPARSQDRWSAPPSVLKHCGTKPQTPPRKVHVSPLGEVEVLERD